MALTLHVSGICHPEYIAELKWKPADTTDISF